MALDPNINRIKFLRSTTAGNKPTVAMLAEGEIAINLADKTIYSTDGTNIIDLGFGLGGSVKGNIDASGYIKAANVVQSDYLHLAPKLGVSSTNGQGDGISLYQGWTAQNNMPAYGLAFAQSATFGGHGAVSGNDWATYFTMNGGASRGWIFKAHGATPGVGNVASISATGIATFTRVDAPLFGNASSASRLETPRTINGVPFNGTANIDTPATLSVLAADNRIIKPSGTRKSAVSAYFATKTGLTGLAGEDYGDFLALNTYENASGGLATGLFFPKVQGANPVVYQADHNSNTWGVGKQLAFTSDNVATATRLEKSGRISTGVAFSVWAKFATVTVPQHGFDVGINFYGGSGYGTSPNSNGFSRIICRSGNDNPKSLTVVHERLDGHSFLSDVAYVQGAGDTWDLWGFFGAYTTLYYTVDMAVGTNFVQQWNTVGGSNLPPGTVKGEIRTVAQITSNVASATRLQTARNINGVPFDGTQDIRIQTSSVRIASGNLNDILTEGNYYCDADVDAVNIANKPMEGSFALEVLRTAGCIQRFTNYNSGRTWIRKSYVGFSNWHEVALNDQNNYFKDSQTIDAGVESIIQMNGTREAAVVLQKPGRRAILTIPADNSVGLLVDGGWIFNSPSADTLNLHANTAVLNGKLFRLAGAESDNIDRVQNGNAAITINSPEPGMAAIRNALDFGWYDDHFQLGTIRSGTQASHGFGITKGNNDLLWRVSPQGDTLSKGSITAGAHIYSVTHVSADQVYARSGRFGSGDQYHYVDVGQGGRDLTTFAQYGGAFNFLNSATGAVGVNFDASRARFGLPIQMAKPFIAKTVAEIGNGEATTPITVDVGVMPADWATSFKPLLHGSIMTNGVGYRQNVSFGVQKRSWNWTNTGAYIAVGQSDAGPTEAFYFDTDGYINHSSGILRFGSQLRVEKDLFIGMSIRSASPRVDFLTVEGKARGIAVGGVLASNDYADFSNVPENGAWIKGALSADGIHARNTFETTWATVHSLGTSTGINLNNAPGGGANNGLRTGNGDDALYATCNWDIQTHNGLGIMDNTGTRKIVFEARTGTIHCQGDLNVRNVNTTGTGIFQGNIVTNGTIYAAGNITAFSDRRLKENIKPIDNPIERIKKLNGVTYTRNDLEDKERVHAGLIAQDVQEAMPESVIEVDGILAVDYPSIIALLTETIKDLNARLEKLEK